jgi:hypothetical protein
VVVLALAGGIVMIRIISQWLRRHRADREYAALVAELRNDWRTVKTAATGCTDTSYGARHYEGDIVIACQVNGLGERRVYTVTCPKGWNPQEERRYGAFKMWALGAEVTMPPRKALEAV